MQYYIKLSGIIRSPRSFKTISLWSNHVRSSRRLELKTYRNIEVMWLLKGIKPDFKTIADFRKENKASIAKISREFVLLCKDWDLLSDELIIVDGSKFRA